MEKNIPVREEGQCTGPELDAQVMCEDKQGSQHGRSRVGQEGGG